MLPGIVTFHFPGQPVPVFGNIFCEDIFPNIQFKPLLVQLKAFSSGPVTCYLGEETSPTWLQPSFRYLPNLLFSWLNTPPAPPHITALLNKSGTQVSKPHFKKYVLKNPTKRS